MGVRYRSYPRFKLTPIWVLIAVNFLLFIVTIVWGKDIIIIQGIPVLVYKAHYYLGLMPAAFWERLWTIVTNLFIHDGHWHIIANMLTLYFFGTYFMRLVGEIRFLTVYFGGGILGNILFILLGPPFSIAVGASGAVFALGGALAIMRPNLRVFIIPIPVPLPLWIAVIGGFVILSFFPKIAWQAHLGGLLLGLIAGYFFKKRESRYFI